MDTVSTPQSPSIITRIRRNHALEHATLHVLAGRRHPRSMAGYSDWRGFWILGDIPIEDLASAVQEARQRLEAAQSKAREWLAKADPFTERIEKGDKTLFRARFVGLEKDKAEAACKHLKRNEIPCMLLKN